jgi:hypothetical protein
MRSRTRWSIAVLAVAGVGCEWSAAAAGRVLPIPLQEAVTLLGWSGDDVPAIELAPKRPRDASAKAAAWVRITNDGAVAVIFVAQDSHVYRDAIAGDYQALVQLAGMLAHERWHIQHGPDEVGAYDAQLSVMEYLHADSLHLTEVRKAARRVRQTRRPQER